ncbi:MAG: hypothetical protein H5T60_11880 [Anaerolineae bacterium]|nr:hypothetical protein [Anaerolineae bacterium]
MEREVGAGGRRGKQGAGAPQGPAVLIIPHPAAGVNGAAPTGRGVERLTALPARL